MKYLVVGAGVLGSLVAHALYQGKKDVTILARGNRFSTLKEEGLRIYHIRQKSETVDPIPVVNSLSADDPYDVIFVPVQKSQIASLLPALYGNVHCKHIVFIGNNCTADKTADSFYSFRQSKADVWFGFLHCGGSHKDNVIHNWHPNVCNFEIGPAKNKQPVPSKLLNTFSNTCLKMEAKPDMNAWLKYHCALIAPICLAIQIDDRKKNSFFRSRALHLSIQAVKEGMAFLKNQGFLLDAPHDMGFLNFPTGVIQFCLALLLPTKTGHYIAIDHALAAQEEVLTLSKELLLLAQEQKASLPALKKLYSYRRQLS